MHHSDNQNECHSASWPLKEARYVVTFIWLATAVMLTAFLGAGTALAQTVRTLTPPTRLQTPSFDPAAVNSAQIVVLQNGSVMKGRVLDQGPERLTLQTPEGSRLVLMRDRISSVCNSLQEAYWKLAADTRANDTAGQAELMRWCLKHGLIALAENQFDILVQTDISAQDLERLFRQLDETRRRQRQTTAKINAAPLSSAKSKPNVESKLTPTPKSNSGFGQVRARSAGGNQLQPLQPSRSRTPDNVPTQSVVGVWQPKPTNVMPSKPAANNWAAQKMLTAEGTFAQDGQSQSGAGRLEATDPLVANAPSIVDSMVKPVGFEDELPSATSKSRQQVERLSNRQLERFARELPKGSIAFFRRRVEPMIIKNCTGCHQQKHAPRLIRGHDRTNSLSYSRRNIHSLMSDIQSSSSPKESAIWKAMTEPHAGGEKAMFAERSQQAEHLLVWLRMLRPEKESFDGTGSDATNTNSKANWDQPIEPVKPLRDGNSITSTSELDSIGDIPSLENVSKGERGFVPKDPFDPAIFNRRQAAKQDQDEE